MYSRNYDLLNASQEPVQQVPAVCPSAGTGTREA